MTANENRCGFLKEIKSCLHRDNRKCHSAFESSCSNADGLGENPACIFGILNWMLSADAVCPFLIDSNPICEISQFLLNGFVFCAVSP